MEEKIKEIIKNSELYYTSSKWFNGESLTMMVDELVKKLSNLNQIDDLNKLSDDKKLFDILIDLGFKKGKCKDFRVFKKDSEMFIYPKHKLQIHHLLATRKQLDMNGWINESDFNKKINQ